MSTADVTPEKVMELRDRVMVGGPSNAWRMSECLAVLDTIDQLHSELARLRSAPVAVEVPELSFWKHANGKWFCWDGYANTEMTPSRILKDGEIHGTPEDLAWIAKDACYEWMGIEKPSPSLFDVLLDALRSGEAEGGAA